MNEERKSVASEVATLRQLDRPALLERYRAEFGKEPRIKRPDHLFRKLAWRLQEQRLGGLSIAAKAKLDGLIASIELPTDASARTAVKTLKPVARDSGLSIGTTLEREFRGRKVLVRVVDGGFEADGVVYKSLSAAACAISGQHVSGRAWFGLKKRKAAR